MAWKKKSAEDRFVGGTCQLIEVLLATGHKADAERIRDQAVAILDDPRLKSAVKDVETRIQNGSLRTQPAPVSGINLATGPTAGARLSKAGVAAAEADLERYLSHYAQSRTSSSNPSLALVLNDWVELGWRYPKARKALVEIRDRDTREFTEGRGDTKLFSELAQINGALQEEEVTYALFKALEQADPPLAKQCYVYAEELLVRRGEYELCLSCIGDVQQRYKIWLGTYKMEQDRMSRAISRADTSAFAEEILGRPLCGRCLSLGGNPRRHEPQDRGREASRPGVRRPGRSALAVRRQRRGSEGSDGPGFAPARSGADCDSPAGCREFHLVPSEASRAGGFRGTLVAQARNPGPNRTCTRFSPRPKIIPPESITRSPSNTISGITTMRWNTSLKHSAACASAHLETGPH